MSLPDIEGELCAMTPVELSVWLDATTTVELSVWLDLKL